MKQSLQEGYGGMYAEGAESTEEPCYERKCVYNDHCCPGSICVNLDGGKSKRENIPPTKTSLLIKIIKDNLFLSYPFRIADKKITTM